MDLAYTVTPLADSVYELSQGGHVRCFLLVGKERALLVDTCFGGDLRDVVSRLTDKPVTLVSTHADGDHTGADADFPVHYVHSAELPSYCSYCPDRTPPATVEEGYVFDVEPFRLEVVHLPGHTPGSIALLEREKRFLISGDNLATVPVYLFGATRCVPDYRASLEKLRGMKDAFDVVYPSHGDIPLSPGRIDETLAAIDEILAGGGVASEPDNPRFPPEVKVWSAQGCQFLMVR